MTLTSVIIMATISAKNQALTSAKCQQIIQSGVTSTTNGNTISHTPIILWVKTFSHTPYGVTKFAGKTFSSDLRKLTAVSESLSKSKSKYSGIEKII